MSADEPDINEERPSGNPEPSDDQPSDTLPEIEDANVVDPVTDAEVGEDDPQLLDPTARSFDSTDVDETQTEEIDIAAVAKKTQDTANKDDTSDTDDTISDDDQSDDADEEFAIPLDRERSARPLIIELRKIEAEVRTLLDGRDGKRKRKLGGTRRWLELEEDLISWRYANRFDETTLAKLQQLVRKRHHLFNHLYFLAGTRPTWNS